MNFPYLTPRLINLQLIISDHTDKQLINLLWISHKGKPQSIPRHRHIFNQDRSGLLSATNNRISTDCHDLFEHVG